MNPRDIAGERKKKKKKKRPLQCWNPHLSPLCRSCNPHQKNRWCLLDPIWRPEQAQQTTIFRLRIEHCGLNAHLKKRISISDTSLCEFGQADQTPDHVLQSCPKYAERRQLTWPQGADLVTKLWGSAKGLYRTAGFVASTRLKIWPALLSIAEEEEEEEEEADAIFDNWPFSQNHFQCVFNTNSLPALLCQTLCCDAILSIRKQSWLTVLFVVVG